MTALNKLPVVNKTPPGEVIPLPPESAQLPVSTPLSPFGSIEGFVAAQRMASALSASTFVPKEFKNNIGDCLIILETASRTNMPIMALMQSMFVVHGKPSFSSSFMAGLINNSKRFDTPLQFKYNEERTSCYAYTTLKGQEYRGITVTVEMAKAEGWYGKKGSKWPSMTELMLQYRATSFFARAYCADLIMGMRERHEIEDTYVEPKKAQTSNLNTVITPTKEEKEQSIDAEVEEVAEPEKKQESKPATGAAKAAYDKLMAEALEKKTSVELDKWRMKHATRAVKLIKDPEAQQSFFTEVDGLYLSLKDQEAAKMEEDMPILCPQSGREMNREDCLGSACSSGCPALEAGSKLTMDV